MLDPPTDKLWQGLSPNADDDSKKPTFHRCGISRRALLRYGYRRPLRSCRPANQEVSTGAAVCSDDAGDVGCRKRTLIGVVEGKRNQ